MCAPVAIPIAMAAVSAAGTAASYAAQSQAADAQAKYGSTMYSATAKSATANYVQQVAQIQNRMNQDRMQTVDEGQKVQLDGIKSKAAAATALGEHNLTGNSVKALLQDFDRIDGANQTALATNFVWRQQQGYQDMLAAKAQAQDRISGATPAPVQYPSALAAGLGIGSAALQGYDGVQRYTQTGPYNPNSVKTPVPLLPLTQQQQTS